MIDRDRIRQLVALLKSSTSAELAVRDGGTYIRVRRAAPAPSVEPTAAPPAAPGLSAAAEALMAASAGDEIIVRSGLVGRFYHGKGPGQPPLVKIGEDVEAEQTIAVIEALGKLTPVKAPEAGYVVEFLCPDESPVGYGVPLIKLRRGGGR